MPGSTADYASVQHGSALISCNNATCDADIVDVMSPDQRVADMVVTECLILSERLLFMGVVTFILCRPGNHAQEVSAALHAEYVFILLGVVAIAVAMMLWKSSRKHPELRLDQPA